MSPNRERYLLSLLSAADRQYARERDHAGGPRKIRGSREGQAPSTIDAPPKPKASPRLTTSARDVPTHMARAPKRPYCAVCDTIAVRALWAYECGRDPRHALTTRVRKQRKPRTVATARKQSVGGRTNHGNDHANLATQVWVPTPYERANGARTVASRAI